jgi:hypothetical protein
MIAIGMGLIFVSYVGGLYGYCLIRGYDVTITQMFRQAWPGAGAAPSSQFPALANSAAAAAAAVGERASFQPTPTGKPSLPGQIIGQ